MLATITRAPHPRTTNTQLNNAQLNNTPTDLPTNQELKTLPVAESGVYLLTQKQAATLRQRIYKLNGDNVAGWKWRSMLVPIGHGKVLLTVWRIT
jgi:hypothetical protein